MTAVTVARIRANTTSFIKPPSALDIKTAPADMRDPKSPDRVKVLSRACKLISPDGIKLSEYASPYKWVFTRHDVETLPELHELLQSCSQSDRAIVMGVPGGEWLDNPKADYRRTTVTREGGIIEMPPSRLLTIDLDGPLIPDFDPLDPVPAINSYVLPLLGPAYESAGYIAQLSSGQKIDPSAPARVRLWFLTKNELSEHGRKNILANLKASTPDLNIDAGSCNGAQINYTSPPIVIPELTFETLRDPLAYAQEDTLPRRWFMVEGLPLDVTEPTIVARGVGPRGDEYDFPVYSLGGELLALEGPGDEIHAKILSCTYNFARNHLAPLSTAQVVAQIKTRLEELAEPGQPLHARRDRIHSGEIEREIAGAYEGALEKGGNMRALDVVEDEIDSIELSEAHAMLDTALDAALGSKTHKVHVIKSSCGLGKTSTMLKKIREGGQVCHFYLPDHAKAEELVRDARAAGIETVHIKGKTGLDDNEKPLCLKREAIITHMGSDEHRFIGRSLTCKDWRAGYVSNPNAFDEDAQPVESVCPYYNECGYNAQFAKKAELYVFAHANLTHAPRRGKGGLPTPGFVVIDEDPTSTLTKTRNYKIESLKQWRINGTRRIIKTLCDALAKGEDILEAFHRFAEEYAEDYGMDAGEAVEFLLKRLRGQAFAAFNQDAGGITPSMTAEETIARISKERVSAPWVDILELMHNAVEAGRSSLPSVRMLPNGLVMVGSLHAPQAQMGKKVILLDATPNEDVLRAIYGDFQLYEFNVKENVFEVQIAASGFGIGSTEAKATGEITDYRNRLNDLLAFTRMVSQHNNGGVISYKRVIPKIQVTHENYELAAMHYGALRGKNEMEHKTVLTLIGRILIGANDAEKGAVVIYEDTPVNEDGVKYTFANAVYKVREGTGKVRLYARKPGMNGRGGKMVHPDARVDRFKDYKMISEYVQARGRFRGVRAERQKLLINCNSFPTGQPVDRLYTEAEQLLGPWRLCELLEKHGFYLPLRPRYLAETFPEYFENYKAAERFVEDVRGWMRSECLFFCLMYEQDNDTTAQAPWRKGSRGRVKEPGEIIRVRTWEEVRTDKNLNVPRPFAVETPEPGDLNALLKFGIRKTALAVFECAG